MKNRVSTFRLSIFFTLLGTCSFGQYSSKTEDTLRSRFPWPAEKQVAVSLSFDDGRASQLDTGLPILDKYGVKATFYVNPSNIEERLADWKLAASRGHEIANHTLTHPCSGNFAWSRKNAVEELSLDEIAREVDGASRVINELFGFSPATFAYPCGQKYVGRGQQVSSYVPLISKKFVAGRGWRDEASNDPFVCDLAQIFGVELDGLSLEKAERLVEEARENGHWLVFCGHDIGGPAKQTTLDTTLEALCRYSLDPANGVWIDTVERVGRYVQDRRKQH